MPFFPVSLVLVKSILTSIDGRFECFSFGDLKNHACLGTSTVFFVESASTAFLDGNRNLNPLFVAEGLPRDGDVPLF